MKVKSVTFSKKDDVYCLTVPSTHLFVLAMRNYGIVASQCWAGAQAFSSFDTYLAPFIKKDEMTPKEVRQCMQEFLYSINVPSRWGSQAPFSNITLDVTVPKDIKKKHPIIGGEKMKFTYGDCQPEVELLTMELFKLFEEGDADGNIFQYPIPTINIVKTTDWDSPVMNQIMKVTAKYGVPYFSNYVNSDLDPSDVRSMCVTESTPIKIRTKRPWSKITHDNGRIEYVQA
jgi:ribonucleoside-triphosphate reductase